MKVPQVIKKDRDSIFKEIKGKIPFYTPEWSFEEPGDFGVAISNIFAYISEIAIKRLNDSPQLHFLSFLETINIPLLPPQPARVPLTFLLSKGTQENVLIPAFTQSSASGPDGKPIIFETEKNFLATPSKLVAVFSTIKQKDAIFDHTIAIGGADSTELFNGDNLQKHIMYIGDKNLFNIKNAEIFIDIKIHGPDNLLGKLITDSGYVTWEYSFKESTQKQRGKEVKTIQWSSFNAELTQNKQLELTKVNPDESISEVELNGIKSRWIKCEIIDSNIKELKDLQIESLKVNVLNVGTSLDLAFYNNVPIDLEKMRIEGIFPFGTKPQIYDTFYFACKDAFSKRGYHVEITFNLTPGISSDEINIPQLSWEYWDGEGWSYFENEAITENMSCSIVHKGTPQRGVNNQIILASDASTIDDDYKNMWIKITDSSGNIQIRTITGYTGSTKTAVVDSNWDTAPNSTFTYIILDIQPTKRTVTIKSLPELKPISVNGKENYWIRARLVAGNYGKEYVIKGNIVNPGQYYPPRISNLNISYRKVDGEQPENILTKNNLTSEFSWKKTDDLYKSFKPFSPLPDFYPAVYFGFDRALKGGPFNLLISLVDRLFPEDSRPKVKWESLFDAKIDNWKEIDALDEISGFTKSGMIQLIFSEDMKRAEMFGLKDLYWIRATVTENFFLTDSKTMPPPLKETIKDVFGARPFHIFHPVKGLPKNVMEIERFHSIQGRSGIERTKIPTKPEIIECEGEFNVFNGIFVQEGSIKLPPQILGFYLNSVWAIQSKTITDEIIGSSSGEANQKFRLQNTPVINAKIWVNEFSTLSESERKTLLENSKDAEEIKDSEGNVIEFWVSWKETDDFIDSKSSDRYFMIDKTSGEVQFSDGKNGMIPPIGLNNIRATYTTGGGKSGNLSAAGISKLQSSIAFVDKVYNPVASDGGTDTEEMDVFIERAPSVLKHRRRAVALEDFEWLAKEASRKVAKVKVLPNFNVDGKYETGQVTVIIVPESRDDKPKPSPELRRRVGTYLNDGCSNVATINVIPPTYVKVTIKAQVVTKSIDAIPVIEQKAKRTIAEFLHPLLGGVEGKGWSFGASPCISDIYSLLENIENVNHVDQVTIMLETEDGSKKKELSDSSGIIKLPDYALPYSGEHDITAQWADEKE